MNASQVLAVTMVVVMTMSTDSNVPALLDIPVLAVKQVKHLTGGRKSALFASCSCTRFLWMQF